MEALLSVKGACDLLNCSRATLYRLIDSGQIASMKVAGKRMFEPSDIREYLDRCRFAARRKRRAA